MTTDIDAVRARVRALLSKTVENGCTEAEAMAAASMARKIMDQHRIDQGDLGMKAEGTATLSVDRPTHRTLDLRWQLAGAVAKFCDCKAWGDRERINRKVHFFGLRSDVDFAVWLIESLDKFVRAASTEYMVNVPPSAINLRAARPLQDAEKAFVIGCILRINRRLVDLTDARKAAMDSAASATAGGRSLVLVKDAIVQKAFEETGVQIAKRASTSRAQASSAGAFRAGLDAGDRANFGRPIEGKGSPKAIA